MNRVEKYIGFREKRNYAEAKKTRVWEVFNKRFDCDIGKVKWYGGWRKYVFFSEFDIMGGGVRFFDSDGLRLIADFCDKVTKEHYQGKGIRL